MKQFFQTYTTEQAKAKHKEYEAKTGLKWDCYSMHGGYNIVPIVTSETPTDEEKAQRLLPFIAKSGIESGQGFVTLAKKSGMELADVLIAAKTLVKNAQAVGVVDSLGGFAGIYLGRKQ